MSAKIHLGRESLARTFRQHVDASNYCAQRWPGSSMLLLVYGISPRAIRDALPAVSLTKISELEQEVPALKPLFEMLRQQPAETRQIPFLPAQVGLNFEQVKFLEQQGLLTRLHDDERLYMPEIVRHGLGYRLGAPGRAKVVALYRAALARRPELK